MDDLSGKVALVTGGGRGIGRAIALALARAGAHVAVLARSQAEIAAVAREVEGLGRRALALRVDLADRAAVAEGHALLVETFGAVDVLVNDAGVDASGPVHRILDETWDEVLAVNLTAPFLLVRACLPAMVANRFGRILNVASVAGKVGLKYAGAYSASKHGLIGLTRSTAAEYGRKGVTSNALCPGWTETRMMADAVAATAKATGLAPEEARLALTGRIPIGRPTTAEEVAEMALAVVRNPGVNGQAIHVDGGEFMA